MKINNQNNFPDISSPEVIIDTKLKEKCKTVEEKQVIVHITIQPNLIKFAIRISLDTCLIPHNGGASSKLIAAYNITYFPEWHFVDAWRYYKFTLIFQGLPSGYKSFDLIENISPNPFEFRNIPKNETGVYHLTF